MMSEPIRPLARPNNPIVFASAPVEQHLDRYRAAGFSVSDHIARWDPGLRNGFVELWPEYLELLTVEDEAAFERDADQTLVAQRASARIHAVELYSQDTPLVRERLSAAGVELPAVQEARMATTDAEARPDFYFLELPQLPGTLATTMTSTFEGTAMRRFAKVSPNGVFGLAGLTMVVDDVRQAQRLWAAVIEPGVHDLDFTTASGWQERCEQAGPETGVVCLHLLSQDVDRTVTAMLAAGWERGSDLDGHPHLLPHPGDHVRFTIRPGNVETWLRRRREVLGEQLQLQ